MKINVSKIKKWDFKQRLEEIEDRLANIDNYEGGSIPSELMDNLKEIRQIVKYWKDHMKGKDEKPQKKRSKGVNLWT